jgi:hypothetical protein
MFVAVSEFQNNRLRITTDKYSEILLTNNIQYIENKYGQMLLGKDLWDLFVADSGGGVPTTTRFLNIFNPFQKLTNCNNIYTSEGMKTMFMDFIYHEHSSSQINMQTSQGSAKTKTETANNGQNMHVVKIYNEGVNTYNAIQYYIMQNITEYPEFTGSKLDYIDNLFI